MKKNIGWMLMLGWMVALSGCALFGSTQAVGPATGTEPTTVSSKGTQSLQVKPALANTNGNYSNGGYFALGDGWQCYSDTEHNLALMKQTDGQDIPVALDAELVSNISLTKDWIVFTMQNSPDAPAHLWRMRHDGTQKQQISDASVFNQMLGGAIVVGERIYFTNQQEDNQLWTMTLDGEDLNRITDHSAVSVRFDEGWLFYVHVTDSGSGEPDNQIWKVRSDGGGAVQIADGAGEILIPHEGWLYYNRRGDQPGLARIRYDGTEQQQILERPVRALNLAGSQLFYVSQEEDALYSSKLDGTDAKKLGKGYRSVIQIGGDRLYLHSFEDGSIRQLKLDGTVP